MPHILKNKNLQIIIDLPDENYNFSRFDWTGKIVDVKFQNIQLAGVERTDCDNENFFGKGFYNEFGIETALGFKEADIGGWFHKIGVGLLKKDSSQYLFTKKYEVKPAEFKIIADTNKISIHCKSALKNGYAYILRKEILLLDNGFTISYNLQNTGEKNISTDEYAHNFMAINKDLIGSDYTLKFPFQLQSNLFNEIVNPEQKVDISQNNVTFNGTPTEPFFFSNLIGDKRLDAEWELINLKNNIGIRETGNFKTNKVNLWGWKHVISPELFYHIFIEPGQSSHWFRTYEMFKIT